MRNREVKQRLRKAFDNAAPALKDAERSFRPIHIGEPFPSEKKYRQPLPRWTLAAAAAVLLFFCGFIGFHAHPFAAKSRIESAAGPGEGLSPTPAPAVSSTAAPTTQPTGVTVQANEPASDATLLDEATVKALVLSHAELTETAVQEPIGEEKAKEIALQHAGVSASKAKRLRVETDRENGRQVYEVEFTADGIEYDYEIDALTGKILKHEAERDDD